MVLALFIPLLVVLLLYPLLLKFAAVLTGRLQLRWLHAFVFTVLAVFVGLLGAFVSRGLFAGQTHTVISAALVVALAGWYFGPRARRASGEPVGFGRGVVLALVAFGLAFAIGRLAAVVLPAHWWYR